MFDSLENKIGTNISTEENQSLLLLNKLSINVPMYFYRHNNKYSLTIGKPLGYYEQSSYPGLLK